MSQKSFGFFQKISNNLNEIASNYQNIESERDTFISHVSHELKTPLMLISGFADGMLDKTIPENEYSKYIKIVSGEAHRLSRLVNSMVNLSKLESGKKPLDKTNINLIELTLNCLLTFEKQIDLKKIDIKGLDIGKIMVYADSDLIHEVLFNLIENAVKFVNDKGTIRNNFV